MIKVPHTSYPVNDLIRERWSARSFRPEPLSKENMLTLLEAASWAASASNEQPWEYYYAIRGTEAFNELWSRLAGGNQPWTKNAGALVVSVARTCFAANGKTNIWAMHDTGMANATLLLQAISMKIYAHPMGGFDKIALHEFLQLGPDQEIACVIALGQLDEADKLDEPFRSREITPRTRKSLQEFGFEL